MDQLICRLSLTWHLSDAIWWSDSGYTFCRRISQKWFCVHLSHVVTQFRFVPYWYVHSKTWVRCCLGGFSVLKLLFHFEILAHCFHMLCSHILLVNIYFLNTICYLDHFSLFVIFLNEELILIFFCCPSCTFRKKSMCRECGWARMSFSLFWFYCTVFRNRFLCTETFSAFW